MKFVAEAFDVALKALIVSLIFVPSFLLVLDGIWFSGVLGCGFGLIMLFALVAEHTR